MPKSKLIIASAIAAATILALSACTSGTMLAAMDDTPDKFPEWMDSSSELPAEDLTHIGDSDDLTVYASRNDDGEWCAIVALAPSTEGAQDWSASSSCVTGDEFSASGAWIHIEPPSRTIDVKVLPDDFNGLLEDGYARVNDNLAVRDER